MTTKPDPADLSAPAQAVLVESASDHPGPLPEDTGGKKSKNRSQVSDFWRPLKRNKIAMTCPGAVAIIVLLALGQPFISPYDPYDQNLLNALQPPNADHWFGTDVLGRDLYSGMLYGLKLALIVGLATMVGSMTLGVLLGAIAGYRGGFSDGLVMRIPDLFLAFPYLIGALLLGCTFCS